MPFSVYGDALEGMNSADAMLVWMWAMKDFSKFPDGVESVELFLEAKPMPCDQCAASSLG